MLPGSVVTDEWHNWHSAQLGTASQGPDPEMDRLRPGSTPAVTEKSPRMQSAISVSAQGKMAGLSGMV